MLLGVLRQREPRCSRRRSPATCTFRWDGRTSGGAPKTNTRGQVYEVYLTHRITQRFIFKLDAMKYVYDYSGSGWHLGDPKSLNSLSVLGFPTYKDAFMSTASLIARF